MRRKQNSLLFGLVIVAGLYLISRYSYLLVHSLTELLSIVVAVSIFVILWNSRRFPNRAYYLLVGIAYLFVGGIDMIHTLAYSDKNVFQGYGIDLSVQLWIAARYVESLSLLAAPLFLRRRVSPHLVLAGYGVATGLLLVTIFGGLFPTCYVEGAGLTPFTKISEYLIATFLLGSAALLLRNRSEFNKDTLVSLVFAAVLMAGAELSFALYSGVYDLPNLVGHLLKIISLFHVYAAFVQTSLKEPYESMLRQMKQSEETLRTSEAQYRTTLDAMGDAIHVVDRDLRIVLLNDAFRAWNEELGLDPDVVGQIICETYAFLSPAIREEYERVFDTAEVLVTEESVQIGERTLVTETRKIPVVKSDNVIQIITVIRDISARKQADEQVRASLREKEVLLREVHHRVKNNLQIVSSLLDLQAESVRDPEALQVLHDSQNRVRSMALVHESLYHSQDLARVDVASYAQALVGYLVGTYASLADDITVNVEADDLALTLDAAIPCGLIVNELVSNALKHAFSPHREGRITVEIRGHANGQVMLAIRDNGVGLPPDWELSSARSLGLQLVDMLTQQLGGTIEIDANDGASFIIRFGGESDQETQQASRDEMGMEAGP